MSKKFDTHSWGLFFLPRANKGNRFLFEKNEIKKPVGRHGIKSL